MLPVVHVMDGAIFMPWTTAFEDGGLISYLLPANQRYSTAYEVETAVRAMDNILDINFSEIHLALLKNIYCMYLRK